MNHEPRSGRPVIGITGDIEKDRFSIKTAYADAVEKAGGHPVLLPPSSDGSAPEDAACLIDALLIPGGYDIEPVHYGERRVAPMRPVSRARFDFEKKMLRAAMRMNKPVLGICYGMQFLNVALGGTLYQELPKQEKNGLGHRSGHKVKIYNESKLYYILDRENMRVNSDHHQAVKTAGREITVCARSGDGIAEAIELKGYAFFIGVQWHPETLSDGNSRKLFMSFIRAAAGQDIKT